MQRKEGIEGLKSVTLTAGIALKKSMTDANLRHQADLQRQNAQRRVGRFVYLNPGWRGVGSGYRNLDGPFSAVSKPLCVTRAPLCFIFEIYNIFDIFAPLQTKNLQLFVPSRKFSATFGFRKNSFDFISPNSVVFSSFQLFATFRSHVSIFISLFSNRSSSRNCGKSHNQD